MKNDTDKTPSSTASSQSSSPERNPGGDRFTRDEVLHYEGRRYRNPDQRWVKNREEHIVKELFKGLSGPNKRVLDLPCGYGRFTGLIRELHLSQVCSDRSFEMVRRSREKFVFPDVNGVTADASFPLPFNDKSFDIVLCIRLFHHIQDRNSMAFLLREFHRVTSEWIILSTYLSNPLHRIQRMLRRLIRKRQTKIHMPSSREWSLILKESGLECVSEMPLLRGLHAQRFQLLRKG
ncbi:MAG: class I SAM-dependent methyltransferase [Candidatus Aminicenantes bacterium]|nr:class I SAM-dependent methyltransferase [Candidatus Aminicenantes bacterium]